MLKVTDNMLRFLAIDMLLSLIVGDIEGFTQGLIIAATLTDEQTEKVKEYSNLFSTNPPTRAEYLEWRDETRRMTAKPQMPATFSAN